MEGVSEMGKSGMVAVVGRANVGKSSLLNRILGEKVSIVSPIAQTTRNLIRAIHSEARGQVVFMDTPGMHKAKNPLGKRMNQAARHSIEGADAVLLVLDPTEPPRLEDNGWMRRLLGEELPVLAVLNKQDLDTQAAEAYRALYDELRQELESEKTFEWFETSAETGDGVEPLLDRLFDTMPPGPPLFPEDMLSDFPRRLAIADFIREKYLRYLKDELPHSLGVWVEEFEELPDQWRVRAIIYVVRSSQKGIVIGKNARMLKRVKHEAETELSDIFEIPVKIELYVKVEKDWQKNFWILRKLGYA